MALRREYALGDSEFNAFLFSVVGEEKSGQELTVLSALARLGLDPWGEAARLSALPKGAAADALAAVLGRLPGEDWTEPLDKEAVAGRLVDSLPRHSSPSAKPPPANSTAQAAPRKGSRPEKWLIWLGLGIVVFLLVTWLYANTDAQNDESSKRLNQSQLAQTAAIDTVRPDLLIG